MRRRMMILFLAAAMAFGTVSVTACAIRRFPETESSVTEQDMTEQETKMAEKPAAEEKMTEQTAATAAESITVDTQACGANGFSFALTEQLLSQKEEGENFLCSPYSVWQPLAVLTNAAEEAVKEEYFKTLGLTDTTQEAFNDMVLALNSQLQQEERRKLMEEYGEIFRSPLKIANALFVSQDETIKTDFERIFTENFDGGLFPVHFADPSVAEQVNAWAKEKTEGKIEKVVEDFDPRTVAAIANAVYFSDSWSDPFSEEDTQPDSFYAADGVQEALFMNRECKDHLYYEDKQMQATALTTINGGQLILLLPKEGVDPEEVLSLMDQAKLDAILETDHCTVKLSLPKFRIERDTFSVLEALQVLGVPAVSDTMTYLSGLVEGEPLTVSEALQKAMIEVDEKGMTAAAVTVMGVERMAMLRETKTVDLKFDRPFAFLLTMNTRDFGQQVLFSGVLNSI